MAMEIVRRGVTACLDRDLDGILAVADPDIVVRSLLTEAERALYHGHDGVRDWFAAVFGVFPDWRPEPQPPSYEDDEAVVLALDVTATGAASGAPIDQTYWLGARVRAGKITFFGFFRTEADALDAVT
jgi:ketosteroid isomerase-like protein